MVVENSCSTHIIEGGASAALHGLSTRQPNLAYNTFCMHLPAAICSKVAARHHEVFLCVQEQETYSQYETFQWHTIVSGSKETSCGAS